MRRARACGAVGYPACHLSSLLKGRKIAVVKLIGGVAGSQQTRRHFYLRPLLIHGARAVLMHTKEPGQWLQDIGKRRPPNVVTVTLANKIARTIWALLAHDRSYDKGYVSIRPIQHSRQKSACLPTTRQNPCYVASNKIGSLTAAAIPFIKWISLSRQTKLLFCATKAGPFLTFKYGEINHDDQR
jgi:hypothetical protein